MIQFYGADICKDCRTAHRLLTVNQMETEFIDITASVANLRAFLHLRDTRPEFDEAKKEGHIGIPAFVMDDGTVVLGNDWIRGENTGKSC